jgi:type II secretory pathway pseudopilin PulG
MKKRYGTSIIEVVISIALIALMGIWAFKVYYTSAKNVNTAENIETAAMLASKQIEYLKTLSKSQLNSISNTGVTQFTSPYERFGYKYIVPDNQTNGDTNPSDNGKTWIKEIEVDIYLMNDQSKPLIKMRCNFLRDDTDEKNIGL